MPKWSGYNFHPLCVNIFHLLVDFYALFCIVYYYIFVPRLLHVFFFVTCNWKGLVFPGQLFADRFGVCGKREEGFLASWLKGSLLSAGETACSLQKSVFSLYEALLHFLCFSGPDQTLKGFCCQCYLPLETGLHLRAGTHPPTCTFADAVWDLPPRSPLTTSRFILKLLLENFTHPMKSVDYTLLLVLLKMEFVGFFFFSVSLMLWYNF